MTFSRASALVVVAVLAAFLACAQQTAPAGVETAASASPAAGAAAATSPKVVFPNGFQVAVEIAADDELRAQGLMYRDQLKPGTGMLFLFAGDGDHSFWMKNTRIALDIIWIDASRRIVHIGHNVPPCEVEDCPSYPPGVPSRYVLEVAGGVAAQQGLKVGDVLQFVDVDPSVAR